MNDKKERKGLIFVFTGNGKGKTTSALGMALRACGYGWKILMIQFIKGTFHYGELDSIKLLAPNFTLIPMGRGFVGIMGDKLPFEEHQKSARDALELAREKILSSKYDMIILDEINNAIDYKLLEVDDVISVLELKPPELHIILTGRNAHEKIIEKADLVTEMKEIKHPFKKGIQAQEGIEF